MKKYVLFVTLATLVSMVAIAGCSGGAIEQEGKHQGTVYKQWGENKIAKVYDKEGRLLSETPLPEIEYTGPADSFRRSMFDYRVMSPFGMGGPESVVALKDISFVPSKEPVMAFVNGSVTPVTVTDSKGATSVAVTDGGTQTQKGGTSWMYDIRQIIVGIIAMLLLIVSAPTLKKLLAPLLSKIPYVGSLFASTTVATTVTDVTPSTVQETVETVKTTVADATGVVK
jgi:hypothetical protein